MSLQLLLDKRAKAGTLKHVQVTQFSDGRFQVTVAPDGNRSVTASGMDFCMTLERVLEASIPELSDDIRYRNLDIHKDPPKVRPTRRVREEAPKAAPPVVPRVRTR